MMKGRGAANAPEVKTNLGLCVHHCSRRDSVSATATPSGNKPTLVTVITATAAASAAPVDVIPAMSTARLISIVDAANTATPQLDNLSDRGHGGNRLGLRVRCLGCRDPKQDHSIVYHQ